MAQSRTKSYSAREDTSPAFGRTNMAVPDGFGMEAARHMGATFFDGFVSMNLEFLNFMSTRLQEDMAAVRSLAECRHPSEFVEAELRFMQSLIRHYAENSSRMLGIAARVAGHNLDDMEDRMSGIVRGADAAAPQGRAT